MFGLQQLFEFRERKITAYRAQPDFCRLAGMSRDMTEDEKLLLANFNAVILTLRSIDPAIIDMERLETAMKGSVPECRTFESIYE